MKGTVRFINIIDVIGVSDTMGNSIQIVGISDEEKQKFRHLCVTHKMTSAKMLGELMSKYPDEGTPTPAS